jgi:hypothetical protein
VYRFETIPAVCEGETVGRKRRASVLPFFRFTFLFIQVSIAFVSDPHGRSSYDPISVARSPEFVLSSVGLNERLARNLFTVPHYRKRLRATARAASACNPLAFAPFHQWRTTTGQPPDVRFTPKSGHSAIRLGCPLCARSGLMQCSNFVVIRSPRRHPSRSRRRRRATGSSPPTAGSQRPADGPELAAIRARICLCNLPIGLQGPFGVFVSALENCVSRRRRLALIETRFECWSVRRNRVVEIAHLANRGASRTSLNPSRRRLCSISVTRNSALTVVNDWSRPAIA